MAIAFAQVKRFINTSTSGTSDTQTYTSAGGSNRGLVIMILSSAHDPTALTYAGVACTQAATVSDSAGQSMTIWWVSNSASWSGSSLVATIASGTFIEYLVYEYTGVDQSNMDDGHVGTVIASGTTLTLTVTVGTANSWLVSHARNQTTPRMTASTGVGAQRDEASNNTTQEIGGDSNATVSTGSQSQTWTTAASGVKSFGCALAIKVASAGGATANPAFLMNFV